jgi:hypothetical protein
MPNYRISVPSTAIRPGVGRDDTAPPGANYDLAQKIKAALAAGAFVAVGAAVFLWAVLFLIASFYRAPWQAWVFIPCLTSVIGTLVACWQGYGWVTQVAMRAWQVDDVERKRRHEWEDGERKREEELARAQAAAVAAAKDQVAREDDHDDDLSTFSEAQLLHLVAIEVLRRHYMFGWPVTRDAMTAENLCTQPQWNVVNQAMLAVGLKVKKTMRPDLDFAQAWEIWRSGVSIREDGYLWTLNSKGNWTALVKLA